jgi:hypothetical protein
MRICYWFQAWRTKRYARHHINFKAPVNGGAILGRGEEDNAATY